ncbi:MAG TPA: hypothetical protein VJ965_07845 [Anaerolineales bacterium]|nr:hypothetical protein [Anaerolineales bacterium]
MNRNKMIACLMLLGLMLSSCGANGRYQMTLITDGDHTLAGNTKGDVIILGGKTSLEKDAVVEGATHVISGMLRLDGEIKGDLSFLGGEVIFGPQGQIDGDLNYGGGDLSNLRQESVTGIVNAGTGIQLPAVETQKSKAPGALLIRWVINAALLGALAMILNRYLPGHCRRVSKAVLGHSLVSLAMGLLAGIVGITLVVVTAYTILLIPVALLGLVLLGTAVIFGWIACFIALGPIAAHYLKINLSSNWIVFGGTFVGMMLLSIITEIPIAGGIIGILIASTSLGAVFLTRFGIRRFIPESYPTA